MITFALSLLLFSPAWADDLELGFDMDDIDLGSKNTKGQEMVSYTGNTSQNAPAYKAGTLVSISHTAGIITVNCVERDKGITARVDYMLEGVNRDALKRFGDGVQLKAWGGDRGGGVQTRVPSASSSIKSKEVALVVSVPVRARVKVNGGNGMVQVRGCEGSVAVANRSGDIRISGKLTSVTATAPGGSVTVMVHETAAMSGSSKISAGGGNAELRIPSDFGGRIYAKGQDVKIRHMVDGSKTPTQVQGTIGEGNASLTVTATGAVRVETSN